jgi:hypothetical protein
MIGVVQYEGGKHEYAAVVGFNRREAPKSQQVKVRAPVARGSEASTRASSMRWLSIACRRAQS